MKFAFFKLPAGP